MEKHQFFRLDKLIFSQMVIKKKIFTENNSIGQIFTPEHIAEFMVKNIVKILKESDRELQQLKVLEPAVGKGVFLKYLIQNQLTDITAYETDEILKKDLLINYPEVTFKFENFLGSSINETFDVIIGNPPYLGQNYNAEIFQNYISNYQICKNFFVGNMDLFYYFIHLGILKLNPEGILSFITTNYWITKSEKTGIKLLKPHIIDECFLLQYIDLTHLKLFKGAEGQHNSIFVLQKKSDKEKMQKSDKLIEIVQTSKKKEHNLSEELFNKKIFVNLIQNSDSNKILRYKSALTNKNLKREGSWNLLYPQEVKSMVNKIENFCIIDDKISFLNDYFLIRNGIIFIKDNIFILNENNNLKIENNEFFVKVNNNFLKLSEIEKTRLKKIYKSKSLKNYGYNKNDYTGYAIYFNKNEFHSHDINERNQLYEKKYPVLSAYLKQFEKELREILINAKENPDDFYFPRRGTFIRRFEKNNRENLIDLESLYDKSKKIFLKYISKKNIFGYSNSSYYATSDTYFLWPNSSKNDIDYLIILAYLNSKLVYFLFKAKNIQIKRSKTKLEYGLPVPNLNIFNSEKELAILSLIKTLTVWLVKYNCSLNKIYSNSIKKNISRLNYFSKFNQNNLLSEILLAIENHNEIFIQNIINLLFFQLFGLKEESIDYLINKYYQF
ncbi:MAG: Eco57I restriction-modification methylase domain-containing protein [Promethearchaeota archaeon]